MNKIDFYRECARLLNTVYDCQPFPHYKRTRWNNRAAGQGRYPGHGIIRHYGGVIHIALHGPVTLSGSYDTAEDALNALHHAISPD